MNVFLLFDYEDRVIKASCDGAKMRDICDEYNHGETEPYYVVSFELEDWEPAD